MIGISPTLTRCQHFAVMFASTGMGSEVTVFSHSDDKKSDAMELGAKHYVNYSKDDWKKNAGEDFDLIISTRDVAGEFPLPDFLSLVNVNARFIQVGLPDEPLPGIPGDALAANGALLGGGHIGP